MFGFCLKKWQSRVDNLESYDIMTSLSGEGEDS